MRRAARAMIAGATMLVVSACQRGARCSTCGMRVDPESPWASYVKVGQEELAFDTPRCAFAALRRDAGPAKGARFREYYSHEWAPADGVLFVPGSDVVGPMGPDFVPVAATSASRFARDHNGAPPKSAEQILEEGVP